MWTTPALKEEDLMAVSHRRNYHLSGAHNTKVRAHSSGELSLCTEWHSSAAQQLKRLCSSPHVLQQLFPDAGNCILPRVPGIVTLLQRVPT